MAGHNRDTDHVDGESHRSAADDDVNRSVTEAFNGSVDRNPEPSRVPKTLPDPVCRFRPSLPRFRNSRTDPIQVIGQVVESDSMHETDLRVSPHAAAEAIDGSEQHTPELPSFETDAPRLVVEDEPRPTIVLQSLVLGHALTTGGDVYWLDAANQANTASMSQLSPNPRVLDRITVARAFTPYQHHELARTLSTELDAREASRFSSVRRSMHCTRLMRSIARRVSDSLPGRSQRDVASLARTQMHKRLLAY